MRRVVITGLGCVTPIGSTPRELWHSVIEMRSGIGPLSNRFPGLRFTHAAEVREFDPASRLSASQRQTSERAAQFAILAARQAVEDSGLLAPVGSVASLVDRSRIAILTGCATGGRSAEEPEIAGLYTKDARVHPLTIPRAMSSNGTSQIALDHGITGPAFNLSTACASGAHAIGLAFGMVRSGQVDAAIAGGHEAPLTFAYLRAWDSMRVVSPGGCRPFSADRDGMTLAEGAAYLVLETLESAEARGAHIHAELLGSGTSSDAHHITQPLATGPASAMLRCLADAGVDPGEVDYINAHGTGTRSNDAVETEALHAVFGERMAHLPVSSTKGLHGHSIGASGAIEAVITALALEHGLLPANAGTTACDPALALDLILGEPRPSNARVALSNSLAFGGLNAVLALGRYDRASQLRAN